MGELKECPNCKSTKLIDRYVYIQCEKCLMCGPMQNGGHNDDHADHFDNELAREKWNNLPRRK